MGDIFNTQGFMPHGHCYLWKPGVLWLHVISDLLIVLSYYSIPLALIYFIRKRTDLAFNWVFRLFAAFIFWCGTSHLMAIWVIWNPDYWIDGGVKAMTAGVSVVTTVALWPLIPKMLQYPSPGELQRANQLLRDQIAERMRTETELSELNETLEQRVRDRTRELEAEEKKFRLVVEAMPSAIVMVGHDQRIVLLNQEAEQLFGYERSELEGRAIDVLIPERFRNEHPVRVKSFLADPKARAMGAGRDLYGRRKDGSEVPVEIGLNPIIGPDGLISVLASVIDITERKRSEDKLRTMNADLEQFTYAISHDLREPLRAMSGYAYLLKQRFDERGLDETDEEFFAHIMDGATRMDRMIKGLLGFSRAGRKAVSEQAVDLGELVEEILEDLQGLKQRTGAEVAMAELPVVISQRVPVRQVFQNLIANAMKHGAREGESPVVEIRAARDDGHWRIEVSDQGPGIAPGQQERVFKIFQQLNPNDGMDGSGVGLAVSRKLVEAIGGRIWVESDGEHGTTFVFTLPAGDGEAQEVRDDAGSN